MYASTKSNDRDLLFRFPVRIHITIVKNHISWTRTGPPESQNKEQSHRDISNIFQHDREKPYFS